jgi:ABC-type ATPase involved in cell division
MSLLDRINRTGTTVVMATESTRSLLFRARLRARPPPRYP